MKIIKTFLFYLKSKFKFIALFILFTLVFLSVFSLYSLNIEAVLYAFLLCFVAGLLAAIADFFFFYKRYSTLEKILKAPDFGEAMLQKPHGLIEEEYYELTRLLYEKIAGLSAKQEVYKRDATDYYSAWVHQIKTPISAAKLILQEADFKEKSELDSELFKIEQYVEMVLYYLRSQWQRQGEGSDFSLKKYKLDDIIRQALRKYAPLFIRKKIGAVYDGCDAFVLTDSKWLSFVIEQLLSNAIKYTRVGSVTIIFEANVLSITDTGIGIAPEDLPRICEKGFTGFNGRVNTSSTGIGLYLSKKILKGLSHKLEITSKAGVSTTAKIIFSTDEIKIE